MENEMPFIRLSLKPCHKSLTFNNDTDKDVLDEFFTSNERHVKDETELIAFVFDPNTTHYIPFNARKLKRIWHMNLTRYQST